MTVTYRFLAPIFVLSTFALLLFGVDAWTPAFSKSSRRASFWLTVVGLTGAACALYPPLGSVLFARDMLIWDGLSYFFSWIVFILLAMNRHGVIFLFPDDASHARLADFFHVEILVLRAIRVAAVATGKIDDGRVVLVAAKDQVYGMPVHDERLHLRTGCGENLCTRCCQARGNTRCQSLRRHVRSNVQ